jgi:hypothetical protein
MWTWLLACASTPAPSVTGAPGARDCLVPEPTVLDFGTRIARESSTLPFELRNECGIDVSLERVSLRDPEAPFTSTLPPALLLPHGVATPLEVTFEPQAEGLWTTEVAYSPAGDDVLATDVVVVGAGIAPEVAVEPASVDLGTVPVGCETAATVSVRNAGSSDLHVTAVQLDGVADFSYQGPELPWTIPPALATTFSITYRSADATIDTATLRLYSDSPGPPIEVDVIAAAVSAGRGSDTWDAARAARTDFLFVVDDTSTMSEEQEGLSAAAPDLVAALDDDIGDWRLAVVTTSSSAPIGPVVEPSSETAVSETAAALAPGLGGSEGELGLHMAYDATLPGGIAEPGGDLLRSDAMLAIVVVTDEDDSSPWEPERYVDFWSGDLRGFHPELVRVHAIAGDVPGPPAGCEAGPGTGYDLAVALTQGRFLSICGVDWGAALADLVRASRSGGYALSAGPVPETIEVYVDDARSFAWTWDPAANAVRFDDGAEPASGATVRILYEVQATCTP